MSDIEYHEFTDAKSAKAFLVREWRDRCKVQTHATYTVNPFNNQASNPNLTTWLTLRELRDAEEMVDSVFESLNTYHSYEFVKTTFTVTWRFGIADETDTLYVSWKAEDDNATLRESIAKLQLDEEE